jgi:tRNA A-37 threonylcarbamoyl transferase component Bud32
MLSAVKVTDPAADPLVGREVIGQYRIEKKLGAGGMGTVYLAQQTSIQRRAVIKVLRNQLDGKLDQSARFAIEAKAASNLNHPNIVTIYNYGQMEDGTLFLAMEYLEGETLEARIAQYGRLPPDRAVHVATQIASALGEAHAHGVVHRDLKPANIMLVPRAGEPDFVKVLDFGIAKTADAGLTSTGYVVGTPRYMSPEQLLGKQIDGRSDIYSAGVVLYEMLAGVSPFQSESPIGWLRQHVDVEPKPPSAMIRGAKIPAAIERVVLRALAKQAADRPASMENFALELVAALNAPTEPPRWKRAARASARALRIALVAAARFLVAFATAFGSRAAKLLRAAGSGTWRRTRTLASGMRRFTLSVGSGIRRVFRAIGSAVWRSVRWTAARSKRLVLGTAGGAVRALRAVGAGMRRLILLPPERFARWLFATKRRRWAAIAIVVLGSASAVIAEVPSLRQTLFGKPEIEVAVPSKPKANKPKHSSPAHLPTREKSR